MSEIVIANVAGTATSRAFALQKEDVPASIQIFAGSGTDSAKLQRSYDGGTNFVDYKDEGATIVIQEDQTNVRAIDAPGIFRVVKTTAGAAGVSLSQGRDL